MTFESGQGEQSAVPEPADSSCPCSEANEHVWNYLDGELGEQDCSRIKEHLAECKECRDQYESEQSLKDAVSRSCGCDEVPITLRAEISVLVARLRNQSCN